MHPKPTLPCCPGKLGSRRGHTAHRQMANIRPQWWSGSERHDSMSTGNGVSCRACTSRRTRDGPQQNKKQQSARREGTTGTRLSSRCAHTSPGSRRYEHVPCSQIRCRPFHLRMFRLFLLPAAIFVLALSSTAAQTTKWCNSDNEPDDISNIEICFEPSVGPIAGGVMVTVKGMQRAADMQSEVVWGSECSSHLSWQCTFAEVNGLVASPVPAIASSCQHNYVVCESPGQVKQGDVFVTVSNKNFDFHIPSPGGRKEIFSYYGMLPITSRLAALRMRLEPYLHES